MRDLTIVVDTREQEGYSFSTPSVRKKLDAGDYSLLGLENRVAVERKSMEDFVNTVLRSRARFTKELKKLGSFDAACVAVEANYRDIVEGRYRSGASPKALMGFVSSIIVDFGIPVFFLSDRQAAIWFVEDYLIRFHQKCCGGKKRF